VLRALIGLGFGLAHVFDLVDLELRLRLLAGLAVGLVCGRIGVALIDIDVDLDAWSHSQWVAHLTWQWKPCEIQRIRIASKGKVASWKKPVYCFDPKISLPVHHVGFVDGDGDGDSAGRR
jgi:hypothetical protein